VYRQYHQETEVSVNVLLVIYFFCYISNNFIKAIIKMEHWTSVRCVCAHVLLVATEVLAKHVLTLRQREMEHFAFVLKVLLALALLLIFIKLIFERLL
jgi:hypothetical protein